MKTLKTFKPVQILLPVVFIMITVTMVIVYGIPVH